AVREEVARLVAAGLVDDAAFATSRARSLARAGRSRRAIAAHLAERGVAAETRAALPDDAETELAAALAFARRRRIAPFGPAADADTRRRALGMFARAGFSQATATAAMATPPDAAQALVNALRQS
ncbi:MAG: RecX family transcriptional regulator, partial [Rhodospirillales bacterium]|nr:RecX family transcriptional regulator [Rhodospirillales bacterium]